MGATSEPGTKSMFRPAPVLPSTDWRLTIAESLKEGPVGRVEESSAVIIKRAVLDDDGNFADPASLVDRSWWSQTWRIEFENCVTSYRRGCRQRAACEQTRLTTTCFSDQPEPRRSGVDVVAGHAEGVVVIPDRGRRLGVGISKCGESCEGVICHAVFVGQGALGCISTGDVVCCREIPGLRIAVALRADMGTVNVGHDRYRTGV